MLRRRLGIVVTLCSWHLLTALVSHGPVRGPDYPKKRVHPAPRRHCPVVSVQVVRPERWARLLLIRGFGVRVPGGAPVLTWGFIAPGHFSCVRFVPMLAPCSLASQDRVAAGLSDLAGSGPQRGLRRLSWLSQWSMPLLDVLPVGSLIELRGVKTCLVAPSRTSAAPAGQDAASRRWPRMRG